MLPTLYNTTIQIKQVSGTTTDNQPVQSVGTAGDSIPARIENIDKRMADGSITLGNFLFYVPGDTTVKANDVVVCSSENYKIMTVKDAYGMAGIDHKELICVKMD